MRRTSIATLLVVTLGLAASIDAQQPGNSRKPAKQTPDQGVDDDASAPALARKGPAERIVATVPIAVQPGVAVAALDESFDEVIVLRLNADGTSTLTEVQGQDAATALVEIESAPVAPVQPALEEK